MSYLFHTVFISYSHDDSYFAKLIYDLLTEIKLNVWMDERSHEAGQSLDRTLRTALERSRCVVHIASPHSQESKWVEAELAYAEELDLPIFSLLVDGDRLKSMPLVSITTIAIEAKGHQLLSGLQKLLKNIYNTLERHLLHSPLHQAQHLLRAAQNAEARAALYRRENNGQGYLSIVGVSGITLRLFMDTQYPPGQGLVGIVFNEKEPSLGDWNLIRKDRDFMQTLSLSPGQSESVKNLRTVLCTPVFRYAYGNIFEEVTGVLLIDSSLSLEEFGFSNDKQQKQLVADASLIASQIAIWLDIDDGHFPDSIIQHLIEKHSSSS